MTNEERILDLIRAHPGLTDAQIARKTEIRPHQQVNQICRRLAARGVIIRPIGHDGLIVNVPHGTDQDRRGSTTGRQDVAPGTRTGLGTPLFDPSSLLVVVPCSGTKRRLSRADGERSVLSVLPASLSDELRDARRRNACAAGVDESQVARAVDVYDGALYQLGRVAIETLIANGATVAIISGGYGVALAHESIGVYQQQFRSAMWPGHLVPRCLAAVAEARGVTTVIGLLARSTEYARAFRSVRWGSAVGCVMAVAPEASRGAMRKAPAALGEALYELAMHHTFEESWRSRHGLALELEGLSGCADVVGRPLSPSL